MKRLIGSLIALLAVLWVEWAAATPLSGEARFFDPTGIDVIGTQPITGDLDVAAAAMTVDPFSFFGSLWNTASVELLGEGTHTRPDGVGGTITTTVGTGQLGAYMVFDWAANQIPNFMVWDVESSVAGARYTTIDSDGDGIPGQAFLTGPFPGFTVIYDFVVGEPPPDINVSIEVVGGAIQECSATGGSMVTLNASYELIGGAEFGSLEWYVDGESAGSGGTISIFLSLGPHDVEVLASTATGESGSASQTVLVRDTLPPDLELGFLDRNGEPVTVVQQGQKVTTRITATDICDPEADAEGTAVPVYAVSDGDSIMIRGGRVATVKLPTTAVELSATAHDAAGNAATGMAVLSISD